MKNLLPYLDRHQAMANRLVSSPRDEALHHDAQGHLMAVPTKYAHLRRESTPGESPDVRYQRRRLAAAH